MTPATPTISNKKHSLKPLPTVTGSWFLKNSLDVKKDIIGFVEKNRGIYGEIFRADVLSHSLCFTTNPDHVKYILQENNRNYIKSFGYEILKVFLGNGLLTSEGDFWRKQRRLAQPAFHREKLAAITAQMAASTEKLVQKWKNKYKENEVINIADEMNEVTLDIVAEALFGVNVLGHLEEIRDAISVSNHFAMNRIKRAVRVPLWVPIPENISFNSASKKLDKIIYGIIESRRKEIDKHHDLLSMLMAAKDEETGETMSDLQLRDEVMTIFIAGHETTAIALSWLWYLLSQNPEAEEKLKAELKTVLNGKTPSFEDLPKLKYTKQVVEETLRLYPPAWIVGRRPIENNEIDGFLLPKGINVLMVTYLIHRHPYYWESPDKFDPERFSPERAASIHKYSYFPFGGGPRLCIGNNFAMMEAQLVVATILQHFHFTLAQKSAPQLEPLITLRPLGGIKMKIEKVS